MGPGDPTGIRQGMLQPSQHGEKSIPRALQCCQRLTGANAWPFCTLPLPTSPPAAPALLARLGTALRGSGYPRGTRTRDRERREKLETPTPQQPRLRPASSSPLTSSKQQESQSRALPWVSGWTRAGRSTTMLRDVSTCPRLSQRGHLRPRLPEAALSFAGRYPSSERLLQVAGHGQRQPVVVGRCHQLDAQRQALTAQPQRALSDGQPQDVEDGWKKGGGITDPSPPPPQDILLASKLGLEGWKGAESPASNSGFIPAGPEHLQGWGIPTVGAIPTSPQSQTALQHSADMEELQMQQKHTGSSKLRPKAWSSCQSTLHPSGQGNKCPPPHAL